MQQIKSAITKKQRRLYAVKQAKIRYRPIYMEIIINGNDNKQ